MRHSPTEPPHGRRCHIFGYRIHHGFVAACATVSGLAGMFHDRRDVRHWWPSRGQ